MHSFLYVSRKAISPERDAIEIADLVSISRANNANFGITGALISTKKNFAQLLEGPVGAIDPLISRIVADPRHNGVLILRRSSIRHRRLPLWTMAYSEPFEFVATRIERLLGSASDVQSHHINELEDLIVGFATRDTAKSGF